MPSLPDYCNERVPGAMRLTRTLRALDPELVACWNGITERFEVWAPSKSAGVACVLRVEHPDGSPLDPDVYASQIIARLYQQQMGLTGENSADAIDLRNIQRAEREWRRQLDELGERSKYVAKAVAQETYGTLRHGAADVMRGLRAAEGA